MNQVASNVWRLSDSSHLYERVALDTTALLQSLLADAGQPRVSLCEELNSSHLHTDIEIYLGPQYLGFSRFFSEYLVPTDRVSINRMHLQCQSSQLMSRFVKVFTVICSLFALYLRDSSNGSLEPGNL